jgi:transposase-like protein
MAKAALREEARRLRSESRLSVKEISRTIGVSPSTASVWVRDLPLDDAEKKQRMRQGAQTTLELSSLETVQCKGCTSKFKRRSPHHVYCGTKCRNRVKLKKRPARPQEVIAWRHRLKLRAVQYKGGKCQTCGYDKCLRALKFHHLDPSQKEFGIGRSIRSWESVKRELDKCILVCGNCHDEIHDGMLDVSTTSLVVTGPVA